MTLSLQYAAGLFDGEGWCRVQTPGMNTAGQHISGNFREFPSYQILAGIAMTYRPIMLDIHAQFGGVLYGDDHYRRKDPKNRTIYRWHVSGLKAEAFFSAVGPYLYVKRDQVELALKLQAHIREHRSSMRWATHEFKAGIAAFRKDIADQITALKKVNFNLPVDSGPMPHHY